MNWIAFYPRFSIFLLLTFFLPSGVHAAGSVFGGVDYGIGIHPVDFRAPWANGMGYTAGFEQDLSGLTRVVLDLEVSRFKPDEHYWSDGGRKLIIGGDAVSFLFTGNVKRFLASPGGYARPFGSLGAGISRLSFAPMDLVDIFEGMLYSYSGSSETRFAMRGGAGAVFSGPLGSHVEAQFDLSGIWLAGNPSVAYGTARMLILYRLI